MWWQISGKSEQWYSSQDKSGKHDCEEELINRAFRLLLYGIFEAKIEYENVIGEGKDARVKKRREQTQGTRKQKQNAKDVENKHAMDSRWLREKGKPVLFFFLRLCGP